MTEAGNVFDPGLQPERTLLAWRRTALSLALASAVGMRIAVGEFGAAAVVVGSAGVLLSIAGYLGASIRYRRIYRSLAADGVLATGGRPLAAIALAAVILGAVALSWLLVDGTITTP
ncbi:DUF202 domain-containing protein [Salinibacterium sp.]|uniref:DUF202 domain-containing protein n=1 Tax=Salinibacterium sp. TaxID=1915057 RepID=UPI00286C06D1|nr:DUF202 domain-containing protein [Salinibacterium sp.]